MKKVLFTFIFSIVLLQAAAQKVGLVFSGGGSKGLAHIGVLKALEENNIPIDYVVGTSMGGVVGAMYASGYSPQEMEAIATSLDFQDWVSGRFHSDYQYFFRKKPANPSLITAKLQVDTALKVKLKSNLINDIPLNFALLELLAKRSSNAHENFDSLFVPYRCVVADILSQKMIPVSKGSLVEAVRGTLTVPLVYRPIKVDGQYVFDGGLYNNFPVDVMKKDFSPDIIIGSNVSSKVFNKYPTEKDEKLMSRFLVYMFLAKTDSTSIGKSGVYIQPEMGDFTVTNFAPVAEMIKRGYDATMAEMPTILATIKRRTATSELEKKRQEFEEQNSEFKFNAIRVTGLNSKQTRYVERVFQQSKSTLSLADIKEGYYRLVADDNFENVYPRAIYNPETKKYGFELQARPQDNFKIDLGGNISSRPISNAYVGLQYTYLHRKSYTFGANFYFGGFYESAQATARVDVPTKVPLYLEGEFTYNHWNYYSTSQILVENVKPTYVAQGDKRAIISVGIPLSKNGKIEARGGYINFSDTYSPNNSYQAGDILDNTRFNGLTAGLSIEKNTLNRRQYASSGHLFKLSGNCYSGRAAYQPGNIFRAEPFYRSITANEENRSWLRAKLTAEQYVLSTDRYSFGYLVEAVLSNKPAFSNYMSTLTSAPAFYPLQDSRSLFLKNFRAKTYGAVGLKNVFKLESHLDIRLEGYLFLPLEAYTFAFPQSVSYSELFTTKRIAATAGVVYHSPLGPVSLSFNHYDDDQKRYGVLLHIGYLIYNKRSFE
ncbi:MAG: patatin-like phospholipase family protein [Sphingobacteriaceae bacterium]|jgi:NTE family protein|nr:patatin-like phospholipase family protein [Sphingobacteriaceae bacterium]